MIEMGMVGGVMVYVRDDIPCQEKEYGLPNNVEGLIVEINLRKMKFSPAWHIIQLIKNMAPLMMSSYMRWAQFLIFTLLMINF